MRAFADVQPSFDVDASLDETVDLVEERVGIEHHAVPDGASHAGLQNAARDLVEHEGAVAEIHGVAGVGTALVANDPISPLGEHVDELSLSLVAPLRTNDDDDVRFRTEHGAPVRLHDE